MSEEFGPDFITVTDEDGNEFELELVDTLEHNGITYYALFPAVAPKFINSRNLRHPNPPRKVAATVREARERKVAAMTRKAAPEKK